MVSGYAGQRSVDSAATAAAEEEHDREQRDQEQQRMHCDPASESECEQ